MSAFVSLDFEPVLLDMDLTDFQKVVFMYLSMRAGKKMECFPKQATIATDLNSSIRLVGYALEALRAKGFISISKRGKLRNYSVSDLTSTQPVAEIRQSTQPVAEVSTQWVAEQNQMKREYNKHGMVKGSSMADKPAIDDMMPLLNFNPDLNEDDKALDRLFTQIENINDHLRLKDDERFRLTLQAMADFLEVMKTGRLPDGALVAKPAALLQFRLKHAFETDWSRERSIEEEEKLRNGQAVNFHFMGKSWSLNRPLKRQKE